MGTHKNGRGEKKEPRRNEYLYLSYLEEYNSRGPLDFSKFYNKFNLLCSIILGAYVCNIDLMGGLGPCGSSQEEPERSRGHRSTTMDMILRCVPAPPRRSLWRRQLKLGWISYAILATYLVLSSIMLLDTAYLYEYHINCWRLNRVHSLIKIHGPTKRLAFDERFTQYQWTGNDTESVSHDRGHIQMTLGSFEQVVSRRVNESRRTLSYLGDIFIDWGAINECIYLFMFALALIAYVFLQWLFLWPNRPEVQVHRDHIDYAEEQRRVDALCRREVLKYCESCRVYANSVPECNQLTTEPRFEIVDVRVDDQLGEARQLMLLRKPQDLKNHSPARYNHERRDILAGSHESCRMLMKMLAAGALRPMTRSNSWIERRNLTQFLLSSNISFCCIAYDFLALYVPFFSAPPEHRLDLGLLCCFFNMSLINSAITYHVTTLFITCLDQMKLVNRVLDQIYDCIDLNERQLRIYTTTPGPLLHLTNPPGDREHQQSGHGLKPKIMTHERDDRRAAIIERINSNYLFVLMTYKIFVAQLAPFRRTNRSVFLVAFSASFIVPVLARIHAPYLEQDNHQMSPHQLRFLELLLGAVVLVPVNLICMPLCFVHSRCQRLYKTLASLLAHIMESTHHLQAAGGPVYDEHAVTVLVKELSEPRQMLEQFEVQSFGLGGTFASLVKLHFWWGLVALSIFIDPNDENRNEIFGSLFKDPLGVWNFHLVSETSSNKAALENT